MTATQTLQEMFAVEGYDRPDHTRDSERAGMLVAYQDELRKSASLAESGNTWMTQNPEGIRVMQKGIRPDVQHRVMDTLVKNASADTVAALGQDLVAMRQGLLSGDLVKDWTPTNPVASGLVPFDLEAPAKVLVPRYSPLRNTLPRLKGQGNARQYKRITSWTNSGQASASVLPFFNSSTATATFGGPGNLTLNRPPKISYTGDSQSRAYCELGFSDQVNFKAQFQGLGFDDLRSQSHTAVLWSSLMGEERAILFGRGATGGGYLGTVAAPSGITTGTAATGGTIPDATYYVYVRANQGGGLYTAVSTVASQVLAGGNLSTLTVNIGTEPAGSLGYYELWVGTTTGIANARYQTAFIGNTVTITSYTTAGSAIAGTDASFSADAYDGFYAVQADSATSGYFLRLNGNLNTYTPGVEFDNALVAMHTANGADPSEIWMTGAGRAAYGQLVRLGSAAGALSGYRTSAVMGGDMTMGAIVTGHMNPSTGNVVSVNSHRFAQPGTALIRSTSLPLMDSEVPAPAAMVNVQDYMALDWPVIQMSYDVSTYWMGTMLHYAPAWSGLITNIRNG